MKKIIYIVIAVVLVAAVVFTLSNNKKQNAADVAIVAEKSASVAVRVDTIGTAAVETDFVANGNFEPSQSLTFSAENSGRVTRVLVDEGSTVKIGQTLAIIKGDRLSVDVNNAKAAYENAMADRQRYENAFSTGGVTQQQLEQAKLAAVNAKARLSQANISFGDATIRSSINGIVNKKHIEPGSVVSPGTPLFDLVNISTLKLKVTVNEGQITTLKKGENVKVKASVFPNDSFEGKISFIAPVADASLSFPVEIEIAKNPDNKLKAGMYGTATFITSSSDVAESKIKTAPRSAFVGSVSSNQVFVVKDGTALLTKVVSGRILGDKVEILDGLNDGDIVVISGQINLSDSTKVTVVK